MKHIYKSLVVCTTLAFGSMTAFAQEVDGMELQKDSLDNIQVAFRTTTQQDLLGGVSVLNVEALSEKAYTTYSEQLLTTLTSGLNNGVWGAGSDYLVVVDGMVRDANNVLPHEIAQVTILKGAQAVVLYGSRASKGVIQITTKRGRKGDLSINVSANTGFYFAKSYPKYLGSTEYMKFYNEARVNDGLTPLYSDADIYNHGSGVNPYRYPDLNMYSSDYLKKTYNRSEAIAEVTGGNERVQYYTTLGYYRQGSILKVGNTEDNYTSRFFVRGNMDMNLHELLTAQADANVTFYDAYSASTDWWGGAANLRPNRVSPLIPIEYIDGADVNTMAAINASNYLIGGKYFLGSTQLDPTNPIADAYAAGDSKYVSRQFQFNTVFNVNLKNLTQGLMFRARYGIDYASTYNQGYSNSYATFAPNWVKYNGQDMIGSVTQYGEDQKSGNENITGSSYRYTYNVSAQFDYTRTFNENHNVFGMLVGNIWQRQQNGVYHRTSNANLGLQASYNYKHKYYVDFSAALPFSAKLPEGNRLGFSPTLTLGWRPVAEDFLKNTAFDDLMITASAGIIQQDLDITDGDGNEYYLYKSVLQRGGWYSWADLGGEAATEFQRGDNMNMTFVERKEFNAGIRGSLWNQGLTFDVNFFMNEMNGGLARVSSLYPIYFTQVGYPTSSIIPFVNYNEDKYVGFDFALTGKKKIGEVEAQLGLTGTYYKAEAQKRDEAYSYDYQTRIGKSLNGMWGLESMGFFKNQEEIDAAPSQSFGEVKPGDIRYKDQNGDNIIDSNDEVLIGDWSTPLVMGLNLTLKWKDFTFFAAANGYFGGQGMKNSSYYWISGEGKYSEIVRNRWTPETAATATFPRLTTTNGSNNFRSSDFWMYDADQINLSFVQFTYDMPKSILGNGVVKGLKLYAGGYNLLTIAKERKHMEMSVGSAPQTRFYNLGVKATF